MTRTGRSHLVAAVLIVGRLLAPAQASAAERTLEGQLVTKAIDPRPIEVPNVENQVITQTRAFGVAVFKDGRWATNDFVYISDLNKGVGRLFGYSSYSFDDGSTVTMSWTADAKPNQAMHGDYTIVSGTGAYAGATGKGTFDRVPSQLKNVGVFAVKLIVIVP